MVDKVKLEGLAGVRKALKALPKQIRKRELQKALRPGAKLIANTAKLLVPVADDAFFVRKLRGKTWSHNPGTLRDSIAIRAEKKKFLLDAARLRIGVLWNNRNPNDGAWYWRFVEFGTSKKQARPFLTPAFEANKLIANKLIKIELLKGVERMAKKVRAR